MWTLLETIKGIFWILKFFWFFWKFSKARPSMEHWAKNFFEITAPKYVQNTFGHFWKRLRAICEIWNFWFFWKLSKARPSMEHWAKSFIRKNRPKTCSKHLCTLLGTILGLHGILKCFFLKIFEGSTLLGTVGKNFSFQKKPQNTYGHSGTILNNFRTLKFFWSFPWIFSKFLPQNLSPENWTHFFKSWKRISYF